MEGTRTSLWLFLVLNLMLFRPTDADEDLPTVQSFSEQGGSSSPTSEPGVTTIVHIPDNNNNNTRGDCLIDTEMGLIAIGSAGGLIVCLIVATMVLACQVCMIQRRISAPRTSRSNMDLVSGTGYWGGERPGVTGLVGPCDASVMLEEVRADGIEEEEEEEEEEGKGGARLEKGDPEETTRLMQTSSSRDSCLEVPRDLEDMPLVV